MSSVGQDTPKRAGPARRPAPLAYGSASGRKQIMKDLLVLVGIMAVWFLVVRFVFPKLGIKG